MIFILDTCTINNLLQVDLINNDEDEYYLEYDYLSMICKQFKIKLPQKNYNELKDTFAKNFSDGGKIKFIRNYMSRNIYSYLDHANNIDFNSSLAFIKSICPKYLNEDNGELHSTAYALYLSRYNTKNLAFQTYFVTDDDEAIQDFKSIFRINFLGEILTTIDLLLILSIYEVISYKNVMDFAHNLKKQYIKNYNDLLFQIQALQSPIGKLLPEDKFSAKESSFLSKLYQDVDALDLEEIKHDMENPEYESIKRRQRNIMGKPEYKSVKKEQKNIDLSLNKLLNEDLKKVRVLDKKIEEIKSQYWTMDKI